MSMVLAGRNGIMKKSIAAVQKEWVDRGWLLLRTGCCTQCQWGSERSVHRIHHLLLGGWPHRTGTTCAAGGERYGRACCCASFAACSRRCITTSQAEEEAVDLQRENKRLRLGNAALREEASHRIAPLSYEVLTSGELSEEY